LRWGLEVRGGRYLYKRELRTDQASGDLIVDVASWFYGIIHDAFLEHLIRRVWKLKKLIDDRNARVSDGHQEKERKCTHGEMLRQSTLTGQRQEKPLEGSIK
jgi:hypothetical protein